MAHKYMAHKYFEKKFLSGEEYGMFFKKDVKEGTVVHTIVGYMFNKPTKETIQLHDKNHVYDPTILWIKHGFEKSGHATVNRNSKDELVTIKEIKAGDQVLFDYTLNEDYIVSPFVDSYTGEPVKYGLADLEFIKAATKAGYSFEHYDSVLAHPICNSVTPYIENYPVDNKVFLVLMSDDPVNVALKKLPALPNQAIINLFGKNAALFHTWLNN